ncbi:hypothetical protein GGF32_005392 [Allomyces javanicus]|nr:hypothetical protein GGF32_005392 [Allomyces javanicus]
MMAMDVEDPPPVPAPAPVPAAPSSSSSSLATPTPVCLLSFPGGSAAWGTPVPPPFQAPVTSSPAPWRIQSRAHANDHVVDDGSDLGDDDDDDMDDDDPADRSGDSAHHRHHHHRTRRRLLFPSTPTPPAPRPSDPAPLPHTPTSSRRVQFAPTVRILASPPPYAPAVGLDDEMLAYGGDIDEPLDWRSTTPPLPPSSSPLRTTPLLSLEACFSMSPPRATPAAPRRASVDTPTPSPTPWPWSHATPPPPPTGLPPPRARVPLVRTSPGGGAGNALRQSKLTTYLATVKDRRTPPQGNAVVPPPRRINSSPPVLGLGVAKRALKRSPAAGRGTAGASSGSRGSPSDRVGVERLARELQHGMRLTQ